MSDLLVALLLVVAAISSPATASTRGLLATPPPCPNVRGYTAHLDSNHPGDDLRKLKNGDKLGPRDIASKCTSDCKCKGFDLEGRLKSNATVETNEPGFCLYERKTPKSCKQSPPPQGPKPPSPLLLQLGCNACIHVSYRLRWSLFTSNGTNAPLSRTQCDTLAAYVSSGGIGQGPISKSLGTFTCSGNPQQASDIDNPSIETSVATLCASGDKATVKSWLDDIEAFEGELKFAASNLMASAINVSYCWLRSYGDSSCFPGRLARFQHWVCD